MQIMGFYIVDFVIIANWPPLVQSHSVVTLAVLQSQRMCFTIRWKSV